MKNDTRTYVTWRFSDSDEHHESRTIEVNGIGIEHLRNAPRGAYAGVFISAPKAVIDVCGIRFVLMSGEKSGAYYLTGDLLTAADLEQSSRYKAARDTIRLIASTGTPFRKNGPIAILIGNRVLPFTANDVHVPSNTLAQAA